METRTLGTEGLEVSKQGLGCMGMSAWYGPTDEQESIATIHRALELGITFLDTADVYGQGHNEELVGRAIARRREGLHAGAARARVGAVPRRGRRPDPGDEAAEVPRGERGGVGARADGRGAKRVGRGVSAGGRGRGPLRGHVVDRPLTAPG